MGDLTLTSPAFDDGEPIPEKHGYEAENVSPPLSVSGVPDGAESLALVVDDPDAMEPAGKVWDHWIVWNVPVNAEILEGWNPSADGATEGTTDFDETGYGGPAPPDREHTYRFRLYALDTTIDLPSSAGKDDLEDAIEGHVLDEASLRGTYAP
ncbi:YbhB/YbcL family Raf kinase inhibitor-like protein [Halalkalicoccus sp. NIPERK01]|uniref:YbhB/YbcL family Raf kinase inhibitor-like protein n=1 Tax=Halalkalicoccus sp. NIPERK01 TaxID=3053469 RepID=UPI00256F220F|nr:YbhB/YbcL family Raf kinase inhibitor-like protein [Halalkalicoccus sp. NIPERK01]MDL5361082.1 YbhB/YbcL family Raf kinase inhibitor-like protein [Halalkalicoccus sp. NIPERK01]